MPTADAVVVGGGPAGSTCAWKLQQAGLDVLVLDRAPFPRDKPCAGWITPQVLRSLEITPEEYGQGRVVQPITTWRTGLVGGPTVETRYERPVSYGIRRCEFDHYLLWRSGARARTATPVTRLRRDGGDWILNEEIRTPLLVGAGGHFCPVARFLGGGGGSEPVVAAQEIELLLKGRPLAECAASGEVPEIYLCPDWRGYGWIFRKGDYLNVGFGRQDRNGLTRHVGAFVDWLAREGRIPADLPRRWNGHAYLLWGSNPRPLLADGVLLVGDAAGLAYKPSGEGIRPAVESGLLAAETALQCRGRYRREDLEPYRARVEARLGKRSFFPLACFVPPRLVSAAGSTLLASPWLTRHVLLDHWFLHAYQPALTTS